MKNIACTRELALTMAIVLPAMICLALAAEAIAGVMVPVPGDPVTIDSGKVAGTVLSDGVRAYLGVPFAAPPVRELRWHAPMPVKPWTGTYTADTTRAECVQALRSSGINHYFGEEDSAEDCLYLNLWAPGNAKKGAKLPVLVWIYGGAFNIGSASSPVYAGQHLAAKGVIYVAINYRLGIFGFLAHPQMTQESGHNASGNWGYLDQVAGLQWVKRNIAAFGGDPANVTLVGQSAGSASINNLQASPLAKGLFAHVIGMSGATVSGGMGGSTTLSVAEQQGVKLQEALKAKSLAEMRSFSSDKITAAEQRAGVRAGPGIDGYYLPEIVDNIFAAGKQNDVAVLTGSTANDIGNTPEIRRATTLAEYESIARQSFGARADEFLRLFPATTDAEARHQAEEAGRNSGMALSARNWAKAQVRTGKQPAFLFLVSRVQPFTSGVVFSDFNPATAGAYHMGDVPYWLGTYETFNMFRTTRDWTAYDRDLSNKMQDVVIAFAKTGNPSTDVVKFTAYNPENEMRVEFGDTIRNEKLNSKAMDFLSANGGGGRGGRGATGGRGGANNTGNTPANTAY
jgi:para-nitrobenzyl esterase